MPLDGKRAGNKGKRKKKKKKKDREMDEKSHGIDDSWPYESQFEPILAFTPFGLAADPNICTLCQVLRSKKEP